MYIQPNRVFFFLSSSRLLYSRAGPQWLTFFVGQIDVCFADREIPPEGQAISCPSGWISLSKFTSLQVYSENPGLHVVNNKDI